ncbi:hypothetical protein GCM10010106_18190 [Thermopolyspora flexuosa]|uniref:Bacterial proteasome activator n=1 Tax=Thermopolyspora flexuosa TaxID=103836 RepID=A0A543J438_9ACTN|nr:proteasome activator [Thermopolyspora flexuosa]TQM77595.1 uncharacterized protein DUF2587 [Thermopolyspora flexuosa]GGM72238.1 hypothetical protein GCM10010106_18190 [Thermopolyspora flexuosa]
MIGFQAQEPRITRSPSGLLVVSQGQDARQEEAQASREAEAAARQEQAMPDLVAMAKQDKLIRLAVMIRHLCEEMRELKLDQHARQRLADTYDRISAELAGSLPPELRQELEQLRPNLSESPTQAELRVVHAQLLGWLDGLFQGVQVTLTLHRLDLARQLHAVRHADPGGMPRPGRPYPEQPQARNRHLDNPPTGAYL